MAYQERLRPNSVNLQDALHGGLPSVDVLEQSYADIARTASTPTHRAKILAEASQQYGSEEKFAVIDKDSSTYPQDVISMLFIDAVSLIARQELVNHTKRRKGYVYGATDAAFMEYLAQKLEARKRFQEQLNGYIDTFAAAGEDKLWSGLAAIMYEAQCLVKNGSDVSRSIADEGSGQLIGILAEHKILSALQSLDWPLARYGTPEQDMDSIDIVVPVGPWQNLRSLFIQVKSKRGKGTGLDIIDNQNGVMMVGVPMFDGKNSLFNLSPEESRHLARAVRRQSQTIINRDQGIIIKHAGITRG